ncbi:tripartite-type tricarboxylate transporter receptor subunit TctC [Cupriavidus gilardii J11]|uniref:Tripartite-type tricarboxylate transporter receptor subunit TctC n=1 Tax=Cupriavidus gilardii J11 TaxID=936133 RepID=A0A562BL01_9BURK|nr:tripartite tricarboxylate transporter substrate binding protein [Cupriavidus gilardii]TWG85589.1 tripartite-type tricarboxylate transporter receptor subunit TctC [Cupriavidus gilardii J11]
MRPLASLLAGVILLGAVPAARAAESAADFPSRPIRVIVPFTSGSGSDSSARYYGEALGKLLGQSVVVENRPGANGVIGIQALKNAPADGYTILLASNSPMSVNPIVMKNLPYDPLNDLKPVAGLSRNMNVFITAPDSPLKSMADVVAAARQGNGLPVATYSAGYQLAAAWFANLAGVRFVNVPYKGQAQIMTDIMGKQLQLALVDTGGALTLIRQGKLRALAVSGEQRHHDMPDVPTVRELGYPDYKQYSWVSFYVRAGTPDDITDKLAGAMQRILKTPESLAFMQAKGSDLMPYPPREMRAFQQAEIDRFRRVAAAAGIHAE